MKHTSLFITVLLIAVTSFAQTDTSRIYNSKHLNKGFYRNYSEYINNQPFISTDFDLIRHRVSKKDSTVISYGYKFGEIKTQIPDVWGMCDGRDIYYHNFQNGLFYKLDYIGPYPFFTYIEIPKICLTINLVDLAFTLIDHLNGPLYALIVITPDNKEKGAFNQDYMKKLFASQPDILNTYNQQKDSLTSNKVKEFLIQFNDRIK